MGFMSDSLAGKIVILVLAIVLIGGVVAGLVFLLGGASGRAFFDNGFTGVFNSIVNFIEAPFIGFIDMIQKLINTLVSDIVNAVTGAIGGVGSSIVKGATGVGGDVKSGATGIWNDIKGFFGGL